MIVPTLITIIFFIYVAIETIIIVSWAVSIMYRYCNGYHRIIDRPLCHSSTAMVV